MSVPQHPQDMLDFLCVSSQFIVDMQVSNKIGNLQAFSLIARHTSLYTLVCPLIIIIVLLFIDHVFNTTTGLCTRTCVVRPSYTGYEEFQCHLC